MNFLFHLYLSGEDPDILCGNMMGDFVKGRIGNQYPALLQQGLKLHRRIDVFAQNNFSFSHSRARISRDYGLWRGVLVDLYYDHFLAVEWQQWSDVPFEKYLQEAQSMIERNRSYLPERLQENLPYIFHELLPSYREVEGVGLALERMSRRVKRTNPLAGGAFELVRNYDGLQEDFHNFLPMAREFAQQFVRDGC